jgi:isopenicillin N synthase-like dioxygenase
VQSKEFFALPLSEKRKIQRTLKNPSGYYLGELAKRVRDWKEVFDFARPRDNHTVQWPQRPEGFRCEPHPAAEQLETEELLTCTFRLAIKVGTRIRVRTGTIGTLTWLLLFHCFYSKG